jgi:alpha-tubulin suppressor-like RCC1 family protein
MITRAWRQLTRVLPLAALVAIAGCDELAVDPPPVQDAAVTIACRDTFTLSLPDDVLPCRYMVGEIDTLRLTLTLDDVPTTGLRLYWFSSDTTGLMIRGGLDFVDPATIDTLSPEDFLGLTRQAQVIALRRGTYEIAFAIDSIGFETASIVEPFSVEVDERWSSVAAGRHHSCAVTYTDLDAVYDSTVGVALRPGGEAFCWGDGPDGALGTGGFNEPEPVGVLSDSRFFDIAAGGGHTCALDFKQFVFCWGGNERGQLGTGNVLDQFAPRQMALGIPFQEVSLGESFSCGVPTSFGSDFSIISSTCWGSNVEGQLGCDDGSPGPCQDLGPEDKGDLDIPSEDVKSAGGDIFFETLSAGGYHACGIESQTGLAWCWGDNSYGQLGVTGLADCEALRDGDTQVTLFPCSRLAIAVQGPVGGAALDFVSIAAGEEFTCARTTEGGQIYCWGRNESGQLGDGSVVDSDAPVQVVDVAGGFGMITAGGRHACALDLQGAAYCWGANSDGQLGDGSTTSSSQPVPVAGGLQFAWIAAGTNHTCGVVSQPVELSTGTIADGGPIYCWGDNEPSGQFILGGKLGNGTTVDSPVPVQISEPFF